MNWPSLPFFFLLLLKFYEMGNISVAELKNDLHRLIVETDDLAFLEEIRTAFANHQGGHETDWWDMLGDQSKISIQKGLQQLKNGERIPHATVRSEINQLFEKVKSTQK